MQAGIRSGRLGLLGIVTVLVALTSATAQAAGPLSWSGPQAIDPGHSLVTLSCQPETERTLFCAAVDDAGAVLTSSEAAGGAAWQRVVIDGSTPLTGISCGRGCIAVDGLGNAFVSHKPSGDASTWVKTTVDPGQALTGVSCPPRDGTAIDFCLAVDHAGNAVLRTGSWNVEPIDPSGHLAGVSCTEFSEWCLAFDDLGNVLAATDPADNPWTLTAIDAGHQLTAASCPYIDGTGSTGFSEYCVVSDSAGRLLTTATPTAGASAWEAAPLDAHSLSGVSCPFVIEGQFCAAVDTAGNVLTSDDPLGGAAAWQTAALAPGTALTAVSCLFSFTGGLLCVVVDSDGNVFGGRQSEPDPKEEEKPPPTEEHHPPVEEKPPPVELPPSGGGSHDQPPASGATPLTSTGGPPPTAPPVTISTAMLASRLQAQFVPHGTAASLRSLLKHGGLNLPVMLPAAGALNVQWYFVPPGAHLAKRAQPVLVAAGSVRLAANVAGQLKLKLTAVGKRRLAHLKRVRLAMRATFAPGGGGSVVRAAAVVTVGQ